MLGIYICPKCYNYRMVSRKPDAICFHCGETLDRCDMDYNQYIQMTEQDRNLYRENYIKRIMSYQENILKLQ